MVAIHQRVWSSLVHYVESRGIEVRRRELNLETPAEFDGLSITLNRADLEAITQFHREGRAPVWPDFLERFRADVAAGRRVLEPFTPVPVPPFQPARIERQEVKQER